VRVLYTYGIIFVNFYGAFLLWLFFSISVSNTCMSFQRVPDMNLPPLDQTTDAYDITCGVLQARLIKERFICPGINRECIEFGGEYITPKTFYVMADKGSLKDWKNAIRINGKKIRYCERSFCSFDNKLLGSLPYCVPKFWKYGTDILNILFCTH